MLVGAPNSLPTSTHTSLGMHWVLLHSDSIPAHTHPHTHRKSDHHHSYATGHSELCCCKHGQQCTKAERNKYVVSKFGYSSVSMSELLSTGILDWSHKCTTWQPVLRDVSVKKDCWHYWIISVLTLFQLISSTYLSSWIQLKALVKR